MKLRELTSRSRIICAGIVTPLLLLMVLFNFGQFYDLTADFGLLLYILCIVASLICGALILFKIPLKKQFKLIVSVALFFLIPFVSITMVETLNSVFVYNFSVPIFLGNYAFYLILQGVIFAVTGRFKLTIYIFNSLAFVLALTNNLVYSFRGTVFLPSDILAAGTAVGVAGTYTYAFTAPIIISVILLVFIFSVAPYMSEKRLAKKVKIVTRTVFASLFAVVISLYFFTDIFANLGLKPDFWNQTRGYRTAGFLPNFCVNLKYLYYSKPAGYNADNINKIVKDFINDPEGAILEDEEIPSTDDASSTNTETDEPEVDIKPSGSSIANEVLNLSSTVTSQKKQFISYLAGKITKDEIKSDKVPNIICIMNESLSDLSVLGDFETNVDYMPFMRSLTENTIKGNLLVPVIGAGTSNTEFEFLTGCTTSFLPAGSNAYMSYINCKIPSITSTMSSCGYSKLAFHPYYASGWNRPSVYKLMGFDRYRSLTSIIPSSIIKEYQSSGSDPEVLIASVKSAFPDKNVLLRQYVSDECDYNTIIEEYENRDTSKPFYLFNVTMQNHGGYTKQYSNFSEDVYVTSSDRVYPKTNQYLSLVKKSDEAFKDLIEYFSNVDEPTLICMFGDHQPSVENEFIEELLGKKLVNLTEEEMLKRYMTQFYIWANFDIEEQEIDSLSANFLSAYVLKTAGIELTTYNKYLYSLSKVLPVISTVGYIDNDGTIYSYDKPSKYSNIIDNYERVQYNLLFDDDKRRNEIFYLDSLDTYDYEDIVLDESYEEILNDPAMYN